MLPSDELEEVLQALFCMGEEQAGPFAEDEVLHWAGVKAEVLGQAVEAGLVVKKDHRLSLSEAGQAAAEAVVRRHRLAERLLHDVLRVAEEATESAACRFEHVLQGEVTESICTLLGHPKACPHGKRIPPGACCLSREQNVEVVIQKLSDLGAGECGTVAYIHTAETERVDRLASFGFVPGTFLRVHQRWPSMVVELGETQLALDRETAEDVFVRRAPARNGPPATRPRRRRLGWWGRKG